MKRLIDYKITAQIEVDAMMLENSMIPKDELLELHKQELRKMVSTHIKDEKFFKKEDTSIQHYPMTKLSLEAYVFTKEEINQLLNEVYQKGRNDQYNSLLDFGR